MARMKSPALLSEELATAYDPLAQHLRRHVVPICHDDAQGRPEQMSDCSTCWAYKKSYKRLYEGGRLRMRRVYCIPQAGSAAQSPAQAEGVANDI